MTKYDYFITLTYSTKYSDLSLKTKFEMFNEFLQKLQSKFPQMRCIFVPEFHGKAGLHFHLLTSGITPRDICSVSPFIGKRKTYYAVDEWTYGYATMSKLYKAVIA